MINNPNEPVPHIHWPPIIRPRRLRTSPWIRNMVSEHCVTVNDLIWPVFIQEGNNLRMPIASMPGVERLSIDLLTSAVKEARDLGIPAIALFPATPTNLKTQDGEEAFNPGHLF